MANEKRLIDANALNEKVGKLAERYAAQGRMVVAEDYNFIRTVLMTVPTVDAVEVVHARWEMASETMPIYRCTVCKERNLFKNGDNVLSNYCPNCGATMDGDGNG